MKHRLLVGAAIFSLAASFTTPAVALQGQAASASPRQPPVPAPRPASQPHPQSFDQTRAQMSQDLVSPRRYLNGGDYAGAMSAYGLVIHLVGEERNENTWRTAALDQDGFEQEYMGSERLIDDQFAMAASLDLRTPSGPVTPGGTRPISGVEEGRIAMLRETLAIADTRLAAARAALNYATTAQDGAYRSQAQDIYLSAQNSAAQIRSAIALVQEYRGHAFATDSEAAGYITTIQRALNQVSISDQVQGWEGSISQRLNTLVENLRPTNPLNLPIESPAFSALRYDTSALLRGERAFVQERPSFNLMTEAGRAAARRQYGDRVDLVPSLTVRNFFFDDERYDAVTTRPPSPNRNGGATRHGQIDDLGPVPDDAVVRASGARAVASAAGSAGAGRTVAEEDVPPRQPPAHPDYPTHVRTQAERDAYERQRAAAAAQADAARQAAVQREYEAESARQAAIARREAARLENEHSRIREAMHRLAAQNADWNAMVEDRFSQAVWDAFERNGGNLTTLELEAIYRNYNPLNTIPPAQSLSSAPNSLSSVGHSLSAAGTPVRSGTDDYNDPAVQSLYEVLYGLTGRRRGPLGPSEDEVETANMGDYDLYSDPTGRWGRESGGYVAASLFDQEVDYLSRSIVNGRGGLSALLAQPFNVILTWGQGAYDLDLHMTGPTGLGQTDRFHIYYSATGSLTAFPFASLIRDCICNAGSEVILTTTLLGGGVYRVSVFNFGDQAANSNNLSNFSNATIQIVRGGVATAQGNGTTITGGRTILTTNVPVGQFGNTWVAVELDPRSGRITVPRTIVQSGSSADVR